MKENQELISIIVPVYNAENYIERCVKSILNQTYKNIEVLLIDDGSVDNSYMICEKLAKENEKVIFVHQKNYGVSATRNKGIEMANGKYIGFVDVDDFIEDKMYENMYNILKAEQADISMCYFNVVYAEEYSKKISNKVQIKKLNKEELYACLLNEKIQGFVWNKLYRKEIIEKFSVKFSQDIKIAEDTLFNVEYISKIRTGVVLENQLYNYFQNVNGAYLRNYNENWNTILHAYEKIIENYKKEKLSEQIYIKLYLNFINANFDLKQKLLLSKHKDEMLEKKIKKNVKLYFRTVFISNIISVKEKIELVLKRYFITIFLILKERKLRKKFGRKKIS